jgi:hypothetical protein
MYTILSNTCVGRRVTGDKKIQSHQQIPVSQNKHTILLAHTLEQVCDVVTMIFRHGFRTLVVVISVLVLQGVLTTKLLLQGDRCDAGFSSASRFGPHHVHRRISNDVPFVPSNRNLNFSGTSRFAERSVKRNVTTHGLRSPSAPNTSVVTMVNQDDEMNNLLEFGGVQARAFEPYPYDLPCAEADNWTDSRVLRSPSRKGFIFIKLMKTGGSTAAGINLRIARNVGRRYHSGRMCKVRNDHGTVHSMDVAQRFQNKSFLWTIVRDPTKRIISQFFHFQVSRNKVQPTDLNFMNYTMNFTGPNHYLNVLTLAPGGGPVLPSDRVKSANEIVEKFNFIGLTERMDESAVALQMLLNLTTGDILFLNAKNSGGFDDGASNVGCAYIVPSFLSPGMKEFFDQPKWKNSIDVQLYRAANRSLDLTIERLGKERFQTQLARFQNAQQVVRETCGPSVVLPCGPGGARNRKNDCIWNDSGCGTACLDKVSESLNLYAQQ